LRSRSFLPAALAVAACVTEHGPLTNRMQTGATPYLARAARQPVSWQPWGPDAFSLATRLDRPVLLYVGAEDCRWCATMDREVYANPALGALIDSFFVPVRVDRDERPDVAQRYQAAVQSLSGLRGYPLTVFLTPDGAAFCGGTYFPADDPVTGRGLKQMLPEIARSYRDQRADVVRHAALVRQLALGKSASSHGVLSPQALQLEIGNVRGALQVLLASHQGLGGFTHTQAVDLLLGEVVRTGDSASLTIARQALDVMLDSGAVTADAALDDPPDVVRGGLARALSLAWVLTADPRYRDAAQREVTALTRLLGFPGRGERLSFADRDGYAITAVIEAAGTLGDTAAINRAVAALDTLLRHVYAKNLGVRHGVTGQVHGLLQDQVQIAGACLAAFSATGRPRYLDVARQLAGVLDRDFADPQGGYFDAAPAPVPAPELADRAKPVLDDLLPGANAWAARVLLQLAAATGDPHYARRADATLEAFAGEIPGAGLRAANYLAVAREALAAR